MPKILHLSSHYPPNIGGQERFCEAIATSTAQLDNEVHVITQSMEGKENYEIINNVKIHRIKPFIRYSKACIFLNIKQKIKELEPDIIHIQGISPGMADFVEKKNNTRIIMTWHNDPTLTNNLVYKILVFIYGKFVFPKVVAKLDKMILVSEYLKHHSKFIAKVPPEKILVIPNAVDLEKFSPGNKSKEEYKKEVNVSSKFLISFVASMDLQHTYKGVEFLLHAIKQVENLDVFFVLVGEGELKQRYVKIADSLGISDRVRFTGRIDDDALIKYYRAADVLILPSISTETESIVLIEAMACETAVIATRIHGPMEMVIEGYNGYIADPKNSDSLAVMIRKILSNESLLKKIQKNARQIAVTKYSWEKIMERYLEVYGITQKKV